jgi:hypothetical protein
VFLGGVRKIMKIFSQDVRRSDVSTDIRTEYLMSISLDCCYVSLSVHLLRKKKIKIQQAHLGLYFAYLLSDGTSTQLSTPRPQTAAQLFTE